MPSPFEAALIASPLYTLKESPELRRRLERVAVQAYKPGSAREDLIQLHLAFRMMEDALPFNKLLLDLVHSGQLKDVVRMSSFLHRIRLLMAVTIEDWLAVFDHI
jgi:hypothetical protein